MRKQCIRPIEVAKKVSLHINEEKNRIRWVRRRGEGRQAEDNIKVGFYEFKIILKNLKMKK